MTDLDAQLRAAICTGREEITSDDVTNNGAFAVDPGHNPNSGQNSVGAHFAKWRKDGLIEKTGRSVQSRAPHRKGGLIQIWHVTPAGRAWALNEPLF